MCANNNIDEAASSNEVCGSCGIAAGDNVKLLLCNACKLIKYCSVDCQKNHRSQHKKACKKKARELHDDKLFTLPDRTHEGECPICFIPHSLDLSKSAMMSCCSNVICNGCEYFNMLRERDEGLEHKCAYCRSPYPKDEEEIQQNRKRRLEADDDIAIRQLGTQCCVRGDDVGAVEHWKKAAKLGNNRAHYELGVMYQNGRGVEKDMKKSVHHMEVSAIGGNPKARYFLGQYENLEKKNIKRAVMHWEIAAKLGYDEALEKLNECFVEGVIPLGLHGNIVLAHRAAIDATKSTQREAAYAARAAKLF